MLTLCVYLIFIPETLFKIRTYLSKNILIYKNISSQNVLKGLNSSHILETLNRNKTPNRLSI